MCVLNESKHVLVAGSFRTSSAWHNLSITTVLARKWRPKTFAQLAGQEHVVRALTNALTQNRLHHAYLFTGTRGVGKTTIARIYAKSLNCETGITATPCGVCIACKEIDSGRFVDLIELDAASNTQVDTCASCSKAHCTRRVAGVSKCTSSTKFTCFPSQLSMRC